MIEDKDKQSTTQCPYLSTIKKHLLDFDFEKVCSITLAHTNIYCCLVCGRYFQGRSSQSPAYQHSIQFSHHVYISLQNSKVFCLPDNYEVDSHTLSDIKFNLKPLYTEKLLEKLERFQDCEYNIDGKQFIPGAIGINNLGKTDYATSIIYLLNCIPEIRRFFLLQEFEEPLLQQFGLLLKKIWNPKNFKGIASPHEFLQLVSDLSSKKFKIGHQGDPLILFLWLIDILTRTIKKHKLPDQLNLQKLFRGKLKMSIIKGIKDSYEYEEIPSKIEQIPFTILKFEFPQKGVFNKSQNKVTLQSLLEKYIGKIGEKYQEGLRYSKIVDFPKYLVLVFKRFTYNGYLTEKNSTQLLYRHQLSIKNLAKTTSIAEYRLIGQVCHEGDYQKGTHKIIFQINKNWFQVQDLQANRIPFEEVELHQPLIQLYQLTNF